MDILNLNQILKAEPKFRIKQAYKAVFFDMVKDWSEVTVFSKPLCDRLNDQIPIDIKAQLFLSKSKDTLRALFGQGEKYETVLMRHQERNTVCVSTQIGCAMKCAFCATGKLGFKRNLSALEIVNQVLFFARILKKENKRVTNVVFMGMGEPLLNYENVMTAITVLNDNEGFNIGARKISISTVGILPGIKKLSQEKMQINLALSLHFAQDKLRDQYMPVNREYGINKVLDAVKDYIKKTNRKVMIEYILLKNINDSQSDAKKLADLLNKSLPKGLYTVNIIRYNNTKDFSSSLNKDIIAFKKALEQAKINTIERYRFGKDIKAACGQLAGN